jgi:tRNA threonylcarbamoyladenosine biosynthesis protein TsaB
LLAIETATPAARVAVLDAAGNVLARGERSASRHSGILLPLVDEVLGHAGVRPPELAAVAVDGGPGSFTGLRVGLALAKGICLATGARLVLVPSLRALALDLAATAPEGAALIPCLDAGKGEVHAAVFRAAEAGGEVRREGEELRLAPEGLLDAVARVAPAVLGGTGVARLGMVLEAIRGHLVAAPSEEGPSALAVAMLGRLRLRAGEADDLAHAVPSYGRPPDITKPKPR